MSMRNAGADLAERFAGLQSAVSGLWHEFNRARESMKGLADELVILRERLAVMESVRASSRWTVAAIVIPVLCTIIASAVAVAVAVSK